MYWCFDCGSSLAEFEIEYADKKSQTVDVAFRAAEPDKLAAAFGLPALDKDAFAVIWTTTAWTIPANQALNLNPALDYAWSTPSAACCCWRRLASTTAWRATAWPAPCWRRRPARSSTG